MTPPLAPPVQLYVGETTHHRFAPRPHRFRYRLFQILVDVDRFQDRDAGLWTLREGRLGLFSFTARDHGARDGSPLRAWVEARLADAGLACQAGSIGLLCFPRVLGFVFNPLSIFLVRDRAGRLEAVIYEVNNTFGQTHAYVVPAVGAAVERHAADKVFYVSPFYRVEGGYRFRLKPPETDFDLTIVKATDGHVDFNARQWGRRQPVTNAALLRLFVAMPFLTLGVVAAIHWQALILWFKGAPFGARPPGPRAGLSLGRAFRSRAPSKSLEPHSV